MPTATQKTSENDINQLNLAMRSQPWYQNWFQSQGLDPNRVKLNDRQREGLAQIANANGYQLGGRMKFDEAGNINQKGGFAGMPTWAKVAIAAAPVAGAMLVPGVREATIGQLGSLFGAGGGQLGGSAMGGINLAQPSAAGLFGVGAPTSAGNIGTIGSLISGAGTGGSAIGGVNLGVPSISGLFGAGGAAGGTGGIGSNIMNLLKKRVSPQGYSDAARSIGAMSESEALNRMARGNQLQGYDQLMLSAAQNKRTDESDALRKLNQTSYINAGGYTPSGPRTIRLGGETRELPSFGLPTPPPVTTAQREAATTLEKTLLDRLKGGSYAPTDPDKYTNRGTLEKATNWGSGILGGLGVYNTIFGGQ